MELTPEEVAKKALDTLELVKDKDVVHFSPDFFFKKLSDLIREYGEQQREALAYEAVKFELGDCIHHKRPVFIESRDQMDGRRLWVVKMHEWVLGKDANFYYEPTPSSRSDEFIENTRFDSHKEAYQFWKTNITSKQDLYYN